MSAFKAWASATLQQQQWQLLLGSQQHTAVVLQPQHVLTECIPLDTLTSVSTGFTQTSVHPSVTSQVVGYVVPAGSVLAITGITPDGQWVRLDTNTWIQSSLVHII